MNELTDSVSQTRIDEAREPPNNHGQKLNITHQVSCVVDRHRQLQHELQIKGRVFVEHYDKSNKFLCKYELVNGVKNAGKDLLLNVMFHGSTPVDPWYIGLINASGWSIETASDTLASHAGWVEFTSYTGNRIQWTEGATSGGAITNSSPLSFAITVSGSIKGVLISSVASGTGGTLWSTADFASPIAVSNGDSLKVTYNISV